MTKPLPFTQAQVQRLIRAVRAEGMRVTGIRPDGTLLVDDGENSPGIVPAPAADAQDGTPSDEWGDVEA